MSKMISTSALAKEIGMDSKELFKELVEKKWIYRKDGNWQLTKEGKLAGGETTKHPKFGEYVVWPSDIELSGSESNIYFTATQLGEKFGVTNRKINLFLTELGWIEKSKGGWSLTSSGKKNGGKELKARNGKPYAVWNESIIENKHFKREVQESQGDETFIRNEVASVESENSVDGDFRKKFKAELRAPDGHYVRSRAEYMIDDFLYKNQIVHAYERRLNIDEEVYCDFYLPVPKVYIEFWGLEGDPAYAKRKEVKRAIYKKYNFKLIELNDKDITNLDESLAAKLREYDIVVD